MENANCIVIFDNTALAKVVYASEGITDALGYTVDEVVGMDGYQLAMVSDMERIYRVHVPCVMDETMATVIFYRMRHKNGQPVHVHSTVHYCFDLLVVVVFVETPGKTSTRSKIHTSSADDVYTINSNRSISRSVSLVGTWRSSETQIRPLLRSSARWVDNQVAHKQEPRFCLILNRYSDQLPIIFVSHLAESLIYTSNSDLVGRSLFSFVAPEDLDIVRMQIGIAKSSDMVVRLRFHWIVDHTNQTSLPVETVISCCDDGIVMVARMACVLAEAS
ncbi:uncharacterized protein BYT42DRAFT_556717 [Radiomyces spectabilis]|uniref:uncharacterized protein n=1 Tax=Radiomyces spectabilis TaxID=64574 RepID=UPI00221ED854|nr:uncharacterized protein BYT42DRAFT_556717 [Radiomyces spectabilis]KAI8391392.1 hypothetical protein BYT42DRAFT_556717 [Radiomyces spectabilis]